MLKVKLLDNGIIPTRGTEFSAGFDLYCPFNYTIDPHERISIPINIMLEIPYGFYGQLKNRSSLYKRYIEILEGVIDNDYRGNLIIIITNKSSQVISIEKGERIAQLILIKYNPNPLEVATELVSTTRNESGFGSTGL